MIEVQQNCFQLHYFAQLHFSLYGFKDMQIHFQNFEENLDMAQNSTPITGIAFPELKPEKKPLVTEN